MYHWFTLHAATNLENIYTRKAYVLVIYTSATQAAVLCAPNPY